jgi:thiamine-phosphate pyrophosphorylase
MKGFYFITDSSCSMNGNLKDVRQAVDAGAHLIQYRNKTNSSRTLFCEAAQMKEICAQSCSRLIINDRIDIALAVDADGVHLGQEDLPFAQARRLLGDRKIIGVTVHSVEEALEADAKGADYLGVSPIFITSTKADAGQPCGLETLSAIRRICKTPIAAIGGIDLTNVREVIEAGADMVCAISAVVSKRDVSAEIRIFQKEFGL